ncbi:Non-specific serine/threonine protein kinase [Bertholletia excelsa]
MQLQNLATYTDIVKATNDFDRSFCIGRGRQGNVYKIELPCGATVVVKNICSLSFDLNITAYLKQVRALSENKHRNMVKLLRYLNGGTYFLLIYAYSRNGSLSAILESDEAAEQLGWYRWVTIIKGVALALSYLHHDCAPPIVHRDISSKNVLIDDNYEAHVSDFGTCKTSRLDSSEELQL